MFILLSLVYNYNLVNHFSVDKGYNLNVIFCLYILSVHVWTSVLVMLMSPDIGRNRPVSLLCYQFFSYR